MAKQIEVQAYGHPGSHPSSMVTQESGTTAERPVTGLFIGYSYFDETLGQMVWYNGTAWVDAAGVVS